MREEAYSRAIMPLVIEKVKEAVARRDVIDWPDAIFQEKESTAGVVLFVRSERYGIYTWFFPFCHPAMETEYNEQYAGVLSGEVELRMVIGVA